MKKNEFVKRDEFRELRIILEEIARSHQELTRSHQELARSHQDLAISHQELVAEHKKTEKVVRELSRSVGKITDTIGYGLEIMAVAFLPSIVKDKLNIKAREFERRFFKIGPEEVEINLFANGTRNGKKIPIFVECKSTVYRADVKRFLEKVERINKKRKSVKIIVSYFVHPSVAKLAKEKGLLLVSQIPHAF